jgi:hypothetical protein
MRCRPALNRDPDTPPTPTGANDGPFPQDPTACLRPGPPPPPRSPPRERGRTSGDDDAGRTGQRSTLEHHPTRSAAPHRRGTITVWARLWTTRTRRAASAP